MPTPTYIPKLIHASFHARLVRDSGGHKLVRDWADIDVVLLVLEQFKEEGEVRHPNHEWQDGRG